MDTDYFKSIELVLNILKSSSSINEIIDKHTLIFGDLSVDVSYDMLDLYSILIPVRIPETNLARLSYYYIKDTLSFKIVIYNRPYKMSVHFTFTKSIKYNSCINVYASYKEENRPLFNRHYINLLKYLGIHRYIYVEI